MKKLLYLFLSIPILLLGQEQDSCYSINEVFNQMDIDNPQIEINLVSGWNMIGYPCTQDIMMSDGFSSIVNKITIVKNNTGNVYMPEFSFNGIGFLEGGQGYQIKMTDFVLGFTFCQSIQFPTLEGCTDCEATNFNLLANIDDGTCNYDSDGDGIVDSLEVVGCQDSTACNYNINATDGGECSYAQDGYDCFGNINANIGDEIFGGIIFYIDSTRKWGLVAALEDVSPMHWGCINQFIVGADSPLLGFGLENTIDIVNSCDESPIAAKSCYDYDYFGYDDWWLPSKEELELVYENIGPGSELGNIGGFEYQQYLTSTEINSFEVSIVQFHMMWHSLDTPIGYKDGSILVNPNEGLYYSRPIRASGNWIMGCMDSLACNYNTEANLSDRTLCEYAEQGYNCNGEEVNYLGEFAHGGIVFYVDETGQHGLVAAMEDLTEGATIYFEDEYHYNWGCFETSISGADGQAIGTGYQNTMDIINHGCTNENGSITAAQAAINAEINGYSDWYLPSSEELRAMFNSIGLGDPNCVVSEISPALPIISDCGDFSAGPNATWTHVLTAVTIADGAASQGEQTFTINITSLPDDGATFRVVKTVANGNWYFGNSQNLSLGENEFTVAGVPFDRTVKFQFSSGNIEFDSLSINGENLDCNSNLIESLPPCGQHPPLDNIGNFTYPYYYWSSTHTEMGVISFSPLGYFNENSSLPVRPIRSF